MSNQNRQLIIPPPPPVRAVIVRPCQQPHWYTLSEAAKILAIKGLGRNNLFRWLRENHILTENREPYQKYVNDGYFKMEIRRGPKRGNPDEMMEYPITVVSLAGINFIRQLYATVAS